MGSEGSEDAGPAGTGRGRAPAEADWPRGYGESTWWPLVVVAGVVGVYAGVGLVVLAHRPMPLLGPLPGPVVFLAGVGVFLAGLAGWNYHAFVYRYWQRARPAIADRFRWGMALFLCSEVVTFGSGVAYYVYLRSGTWPPGPLPDVLSSLVAVNTAILVTSSVTLHLAEGALREDRRRRFAGLLAGTVLLGVVFLIGQAREYYEFVVREGFTITRGVYGSAFFGLTGLHGLHVAMGVVLLSIILARTLRGQYAADRHASVTTVSMYWHFVDAVWLVLVAVLYVGATVTV